MPSDHDDDVRLCCVSWDVSLNVFINIEINSEEGPDLVVFLWLSSCTSSAHHTHDKQARRLHSDSCSDLNVEFASRPSSLFHSSHSVENSVEGRLHDGLCVMLMHYSLFFWDSKLVDHIINWTWYPVFHSCCVCCVCCSTFRFNWRHETAVSLVPLLLRLLMFVFFSSWVVVVYHSRAIKHKEAEKNSNEEEN